MAWVKDIEELHKFLDIDYDIFLDYPKDRTKPPTSTLDINDALDMMSKYTNIKYFALSNIEDVSEVGIICDVIPNRVNFVPKIETLNGVLNLEKLFQTKLINYIMLDTEDLYTNIKNDVELYVQLKKRVKKLCDKYEIKLFELYGVVFK